MTDIGSTSFGLFIAFLLPGLTALYSLTFWSARAKRVFETFLTAESNVGLFLLVLCASVAAGLLVTVFRWLLFELWLGKNYRLDSSAFSALRDEATLSAFRAAIDEHYRYHQFWGGMTISILLLYAGWLTSAWAQLSRRWILFSVTIFVVIEVATAIAAFVAYKHYVVRSRPILEGARRVLDGE